MPHSVLSVSPLTCKSHFFSSFRGIGSSLTSSLSGLWIMSSFCSTGAGGKLVFAASSTASFFNGSLKPNVEPLPSFDSKVTDPLWSSTIFLARYIPSPVRPDMTSVVGTIKFIKEFGLFYQWHTNPCIRNGKNKLSFFFA